MTRVALLVIHTNSYFANLVPVARLLAQSGAWEPQFLFASWYPTIARDQARARDEGFAVHATVSEPPPPSRLQGVLTRVRATAPYTVGKLAWTMHSLRKRIREQRVALMILPADNRYDLAAYVKAAHDESIRVVAIPAFMAAANEWAQFVHEDPDYQVERFTNRLAATLYPHWTHPWNGKQLLALPPGEVLARQWLGLAPPRPWTLHSGHVDALAIESEAMRRYCFAEGLPPRQLVLTGSMDHDRMFARLANAPALRAALSAQLGMPDRPLILTALPPDWLYGRGRKDCQFTDFRELLKFWLGTLTASNRYNVVVSLHPSVKRETLAFIEEWGVKIVDVPIATVIPLCDLFVACVSATIQWAIACGKPAINYDVYRFRYPDYLGVGGVINTEDSVEYTVAVQRFATDETFREQLRAGQARSAKHWGILDGKAGERLLELFSALS
jgi:hypothetical protein